MLVEVLESAAGTFLALAAIAVSRRALAALLVRAIDRRSSRR